MLDFSLKYFRFVNYFLAAVILVAALLLTRNIVNISFSEKGAIPSGSESKAAGAGAEKNIMHYSTILERNPFGSPMTMEPIAGTRTAKTQYSPLSDLVLAGTAVGPEKLSYAVVVDKKSPSGRHEIFTYGENVYNYGVLTKIEGASIEITRDNVAYTVQMPIKDLGGNTAADQAKSMSGSQASIARKVGEGEYLLDRRKVRQSLENPEKILTDARLLPNFVDGRQKGFKISEVIKGGLYHSLGLRNGDILLRINELAISNPEVAIQAMSALRGMNRVNLDIIRNGDNMSMNYQIR
jgi:general secretion pathway protein C